MGVLGKKAALKIDGISSTTPDKTVPFKDLKVSIL